MDAIESVIRDLEISLLKLEGRLSLDSPNRLAADDFIEFETSGRI